MKKTCEVCGTEFDSKRSDARYCSPKCRKAAFKCSPVEQITEQINENRTDRGTDKFIDTRHPMNKVGPLVVSTTPEQEAALRAKYPNLTAIRKALMNQYIPPMVQSDEVRRKKRLAQLRGWEGVSAVRGEVEAEDGPTV